MHRTDKERVVAELAERLRDTESLIVADYRGLSNAELATLRLRLREHGARFSVVKNTLARRAADEAGTESLLALLEGPTAIAFVESGGDPAAVAKALASVADRTSILALRGGILSGQPLGEAEVVELAKLPPLDVLKGQLVGVILAPLTQLAALLAAPLRDLVGLLDARIAQLEAGGDTSAGAAATEEAVAETPAAEQAADEPAAPDVEASAETPAQTEEAEADAPAETETTENDSNEEE